MNRTLPLLTWQIVDTIIQRSFPEVASLSTADLAAWLDDDTREPPLLLDARTLEEYAVSHLPDAARIDPDAPGDVLATSVAALRAQPSGRAVVVYCSVGVRSARVAHRLRRAGMRDVRNLEGSIFRWASEGRPVVRDGEPVREVHAYDALWGRLLPRDLHAD